MGSTAVSEWGQYWGIAVLGVRQYRSWVVSEQGSIDVRQLQILVVGLCGDVDAYLCTLLADVDRSTLDNGVVQVSVLLSAAQLTNRSAPDSDSEADEGRFADTVGRIVRVVSELKTTQVCAVCVCVRCVCVRCVCGV